MSNHQDFLGSGFESYKKSKEQEASSQLAKLVKEDMLIGDLLKMDYGSCEILVHDSMRQKVGGVPMGCFLLATRMKPNELYAPDKEDTCVILLRVTGQARLPNAGELDMVRLLAGQRSSDSLEHWDSEGKTDQFTINQLRYSGLSCRVLGTFRFKRELGGNWLFSFGADISNFYSGKGMKIYKPIGAALQRLIGHTTVFDDSHPLAGSKVIIGRLKYASSELKDDAPENVEVQIDPTDLIARRTALFGMSRTGKSNTTKVIASSVFRLRSKSPEKGRIGQLIFDFNGEYANENSQDKTGEVASCLKNISAHTPNSSEDDVITFGLVEHISDKKRKLVKLNFFGKNNISWSDRESIESSLESLFRGKEIADVLLSQFDQLYIRNFVNSSLEVPKILDRSSITRYKRIITVYRAAIAAAGLEPSSELKSAYIKGLFGEDLREAMASSQAEDPQLQANFVAASRTLSKDSVSWDDLVYALKILRNFIHDKTSGFSEFDQQYRASHEGRSWADEKLLGLLAIFQYDNGVKQLRPLQVQHNPDTEQDYAKLIAQYLREGKLVIVDQSLGDPDMNRSAAERIMWAIFERQKQDFVNPGIDQDGQVISPPDILVYAEEAHNLLPSGGQYDTRGIWSRTAKEGSKYRIGLVYATQEPSSIQANILKNTDNWFVAHLNNTDEVRELKKYYDFDDFSEQILKVPDPGFLRVKTLTNSFLVPVQIKRFSVLEE
ncbi:helicase HerA domain-containing protein [Shewanella putrefaciens]|uniref:Helicase HerA central domain-containing protein n=1 Tax=Shewanella putrefaciens (strain CN-32 / ATCC BAA-453) TaxID=319224 RepID=A4YCG4_SHEPC|nr:DUF87 domain-containing protein [Shewanella putrefaciens]QGS48026.1 DUF87 domain-containing protein [Shewanella putrefaciens]